MASAGVPVGMLAAALREVTEAQGLKVADRKAAIRRVVEVLLGPGGHEVQGGADQALDQLAMQEARLLTCQASDIHIEPQEDGLHVRLRLDGVLQNAFE